MNYYGGNIPPGSGEKNPMYPSSGQYPAGGTYLPTQSGLPPGAAQQPGYAQLSQQYAAMQPTYTPTSAYAAVQAGYPVTVAGGTPGAFHTVGFSSLPSLSNPTYVGSQGYPAPGSGYQPGQLPSTAAYGTGQMPPSHSPLYQGAAYNALHMSPQQGYPMHMYPYGASVYPASSPYGPPYP